MGQTDRFYTKHMQYCWLVVCKERHICIIRIFFLHKVSYITPGNECMLQYHSSTFKKKHIIFLPKRYIPNNCLKGFFYILSRSIWILSRQKHIGFIYIE